MSTHNYKLICEESISDFLRRSQGRSFGQRVKDFATSVGLGLAADYRDSERRIQDRNIRHLHSVRDQILIPKYSQYLGYTPEKIRTILNEYPTDEPKVMVLNHLGEEVPNPIYRSEHSDWKTRKKLEAQIEGLHRSVPEIGRLHKNIETKLAHHWTMRNIADPIVTSSGQRRSDAIRRLAQMVDYRREKNLPPTPTPTRRNSVNNSNESSTEPSKEGGTEMRKKKKKSLLTRLLFRGR